MKRLTMYSSQELSEPTKKLANDETNGEVPERDTDSQG